MTTPETTPDAQWFLSSLKAEQMKIYSRKCPVCYLNLTYKTKQSCLKSEEKKSPCRVCAGVIRGKNISGSGNPMFGKKHSKQAILQMKQRIHPHVKTDWFKKSKSEQMKGAGNPNYKNSNYKIWLQKYGEEKAKILEDNRRMKLSKHFSGEGNPMYGKPTPLGSGNGWSGWYKNWYFRSIKELSYMINVLESNNLKWKSADSFDLRIKYLIDKKERTYIADFLVEGKYLIEIKPLRLHHSKIVMSKKEAAIDFCNKNNLLYEIIDPKSLSSQELEQLHKNRVIEFLPKYENKFKQLLKGNDAKK
jgi:hypothetical protein